jgi:hypothetical protein
MAIEFTCPQCHRLLRVPDEAAGREAQCPECSTRAIVPNAGNAAGGSPFGAGGANPYQAPYTSPGGAATSGHWQDVPNYLVQAILCTLFCCLPFGIVSIVYAAQVNGKLAAGDYHGAKAASDSARMWCWIAFWLGLIPTVLWFLFVILSAAAGHG